MQPELHKILSLKNIMIYLTRQPLEYDAVLPCEDFLSLCISGSMDNG